MTHSPFDTWLLLWFPYHAEKRLESIVTAQGQVTLVEAALAAGEQLRRHRLGIVPPDFARHAAKKGEGLDHAVQDRLGAFGRQSDRERAVRVRPRHHQHRHEPAAVGEIDMDVAEVALKALTGIVIEWDESLPLRSSLGTDVTTHSIVATAVGMLIAQPSENLGGSVPLLARRLLVSA